jgi:hypothetical protein
MGNDHGLHCPFLNRSDGRCSNYFSLERLDHAFGYCFDQYQHCPVYLELLVERRLRRMTGVARELGRHDGPTPLVQVTLGGRHTRPITDRHHQHAA